MRRSKLFIFLELKRAIGLGFRTTPVCPQGALPRLQQPKMRELYAIDEAIQAYGAAPDEWLFWRMQTDALSD